MRIIWFLFFITFLFGVIHTSTADSEDDRYDAVVDTKVVEYDDCDEGEEEKPDRKERPRMIRNFVGTNLFGETGASKKCFSAEDIALLAARRDFESLIPKDLPNSLLDDEIAKLLMQYFYGANQVIEKMICGHSKTLSQRAFYDAMGGYLKYYMIPIARYSFYGGRVKLRTVDNIMELYSQCRDSLNTNGNGWKAALTDFNDLDTSIEPIRIVVHNEEEDQSCTQLDLLDETSGEDDDMIVALPRLDPEEKGALGNIWLPFKRKRTFDLQSYMSAFVFLRYFELATRCYSFQGIGQDTFNKNLKEWILENLEIHLGDDILYPGLGAVLRIIETVRRSSKDSIVVVSKTNLRGQKAPRCKSSVQNPNDSSGTPSDMWYKDVFGDKKNDQMDIGNLYMDVLAKKRRLKYIYIAIGVVVVLLIIVFIGILLALRKRIRGKSGQGSSEDPESRKGGDGELLVGKKKSKKKSKKDSKKDDEGKESPPPSKTCFGLCKKKDSPAIIETSSMDFDAAAKGNKKKDKGDAAKSKPTKNVTVDEKKRYGTPKKSKSKSKDSDEKRVGILKKETW